MKLCATLVLLALSPSAFASGLIRAEGRYFRDAQNRAVFFRGVNVSNASKVPPFDPLKDDKQLAWLPPLGLNNIRLLAIWEALEPEPGKYNMKYLERLGRVVEEASKHGIYTVIDFHNDAYSRFMVEGCGSGWPLWTLPPNVEPATPTNGYDCRFWGPRAGFSYYAFGRMRRMTDAFYSDQTGVRTRFLLAWKEMAKFFKKYPMVVGYDIINEPWGDEVTQIGPLQEDAAKVIQAEDPKAVVFIEPLLLVGTNLGWTDLKKPKLTNFAYAPHNYDVTVLGTKSWITGGIFFENGAKAIHEKTLEWNVPAYIGEFGAPGEGNYIEEHMSRNYDLYDRYMMSGAQWSFTPSWNPVDKDGWNDEDMTIVDPVGKPRKNFQIRPVLQAVSGDPITFTVNFVPEVRNRYVVLEWEHKPSTGRSELFFPHQEFLGDWKLAIATLNDDVICVQNATKTKISCQSDKPGKKRVVFYGLPAS